MYTNTGGDERMHQIWQPFSGSSLVFFALVSNGPFVRAVASPTPGLWSGGGTNKHSTSERLNTRLSDATPDALNYSCLHVTLRNLPVLDTSTKEMRRVKGRGGRLALDVMSEEMKAFQLLIDYYSRLQTREGGSNREKRLQMVTASDLLKESDLILKFGTQTHGCWANVYRSGLMSWEQSGLIYPTWVTSESACSTRAFRTKRNTCAPHLQLSTPVRCSTWCRSALNPKHLRTSQGKWIANTDRTLDCSHLFQKSRCWHLWTVHW